LWTYGVDGVKLLFKDSESRPNFEVSPPPIDGVSTIVLDSLL
jgi:hypothetical protein